MLNAVKAFRFIKSGSADSSNKASGRFRIGSVCKRIGDFLRTNILRFFSFTRKAPQEPAPQGGVADHVVVVAEPDQKPPVILVNDLPKQEPPVLVSLSRPIFASVDTQTSPPSLPRIEEPDNRLVPYVAPQKVEAGYSLVNFDRNDERALALSDESLQALVSSFVLPAVGLHLCLDLREKRVTVAWARPNNDLMNVALGGIYNAIVQSTGSCSVVLSYAGSYIPDCMMKELGKILSFREEDKSRSGVDIDCSYAFSKVMVLSVDIDQADQLFRYGCHFATSIKERALKIMPASGGAAAARFFWCGGAWGKRRWFRYCYSNWARRRACSSRMRGSITKSRPGPSKMSVRA